MTTPTLLGTTHVDITPLVDGRARMVIRRSPLRYAAAPVCRDDACAHNPCPEGPCVRPECADDLVCRHVALPPGPMTLTNAFDLSVEVAGRLWRQLGAYLVAHDASGVVARELAQRGAAIRAHRLR